MTGSRGPATRILRGGKTGAAALWMRKSAPGKGKDATGSRQIHSKPIRCVTPSPLNFMNRSSSPLIELLVVMAIVALLAALIIAAVNNGMEAAQGAKDMANLR